MKKILTALALIGLLVSAGCSSTGSPAPAYGTVDSSPIVIDATTPSAPVATPGGLQDVKDWYYGVSADLDAVKASMAPISVANDPYTMMDACSQMSTAVSTFQADPEAPNPELAQDFADAMSSYQDAAAVCIAGDFTTAAADLRAGNDSIQQATALIATLN